MCCCTDTSPTDCLACDNTGVVYRSGDGDDMPCGECLAHGCARHKALAELAREHCRLATAERDHHTLICCGCALAAEHRALLLGHGPEGGA